MDKDSRTEALEYLETLVGQPLRYGVKSPDMELYFFGFGEIHTKLNFQNKLVEVATHKINAICEFDVVWKNGERRVHHFHGNSSLKKIEATVDLLRGLCVKRVGLNDLNDLWLDLGAFWIVFYTWGDSDESWRFFTYEGGPHLVASDTELDLQDNLNV